MQQHATQYEKDDGAVFPGSNVFRLSQSGGSVQTGGPVISRVSRVKTATVATKATETTQTPTLTINSSSSLSPIGTSTVSTSSMPSATSASSTETRTASSAQEITPQATSAHFASKAPHVSVPVNTLIAIIAGTVGGLLVLVFVIAVLRAFVRRRHIIRDEIQSPGGAETSLEKGVPHGGQQQHHENNGNSDNIAIFQPSPSLSTRPELGIAQHHQTANYVPGTNLRTWPTTHDMHPRQTVAELPAESCAVYSQRGYRG